MATEADSNGIVSCRYRTASGLKCAVGALIPDDKYLPTMEGQSVRDPDITKVLEEQEYDVYLARELQRIHDDYACAVDSWPEFLRLLAADYKLSTKVVDNWEKLNKQ